MKLLTWFHALALCMLGASALAQDLTPITIGWGKFPDVPQIALASEKNIWATEKLEATIVPFASGRAGFEALIGGQLDYAIMSELPAVTGVMRNLKFSVVAVLSEYRSFRVIVKGDKPLADLKALAGKKIAMPLGTNLHYIISDALDAQAITAELVNVPPSEMIPALTRGDVDAIIPFPSSYPNARRLLGAQYQEIRLPDYASSFILVASEKSTANPALTRRVLSTLIKGEAFLRDVNDAQESTARFVAPAMSAEAVRAAWPEYQYRIKLDQTTLDLMVRQGKWLKAKGFAKEGEPTPALYRRWIATEPLKAIDASRVTLAP